MASASPHAQRIADIDGEIRAILAAREAELAPFYGMMLYHLGLAEPGSATGKRLRPLLLTETFAALGGDPGRALPAAAAIELLHNFTLIHDDIEDHDPTRHHRPTVWSVWGVPQAINAGDGMYAVSRAAVQRLRTRGFPPDRVLDFAELLDTACVRVCEGQYLDIAFETRTDVTVEQYRAMVAKKTGALIRASAEGAAVLATDDVALRAALVRFGEAFGQAFQAHDDLLGIWGTTERTGKEELNDLTKRKKTLPVVLAFERASPEGRTALRALFAPEAPLPPHNVARIREMLEALEIRRALEEEIVAHRERAFAAIRAAGGDVAALEALVRSATGGAG
ncbi:MAG: polyprenyl synthetase family protein [Chloroflexi bacterium]|nr:polyprenyl synthetase family protein [Chloroflexota bacterium]